MHKNKVTMKITVLGSGTYQPQLNTSSSSYLVQINTENLVFDFGRGCINQLLKTGVQYYDINSIFITHNHADHGSELISFLHIALAEPPHGKYRKKDVTIYGPKGIKQTIQHLLEAFDLQNNKPKHKIHVKELEPGESIKKKDWTVKCFKTIHSNKINSLCYRLENNKKVFSYSGDSAECEGLTQCCKNADLAILDTESPSKEESKGHLTGEKAAKLAQKANVKKLVLTHIGLYYQKKYNPKQEAKEFFNGPVIIAKDLMQFEL